MKIIELVLDEEQEDSGVEAISIVESPAIEEDFVALKKQDIKLAEVNKDKKLLMGALLVPNKPIFRKNEDDEYYIYFSKDTIRKASQLYLKNGNQNNSTLEHQHSLNGLTLVESWIVESETNDKSRLYNMNVPVGTWMGTVKVNNDDVWNEYVKTNKVKGFSIEGYFADKMERPKESIKEDMEADVLLAKIESIVKGEKVELNLINDAKKQIKALDTIYEYKQEKDKPIASGIETLNKLKKEINNAKSDINVYVQVEKQIPKFESLLNEAAVTLSFLEKGAKELGIKPEAMKEFQNLNDTVFIADRDVKYLKKVVDLAKKTLKDFK